MSANERSHYICNICSHWLTLHSVINREQTQILLAIKKYCAWSVKYLFEISCDHGNFEGNMSTSWWCHGMAWLIQYCLWEGNVPRAGNVGFEIFLLLTPTIFLTDNQVDSNLRHYSDVIMDAMASQTTSLTVVHSTVYSGADQRKHQSSASLAFMQGIHWWSVKSPHKWRVTQKMFPFNDVIMDTLTFMWHHCKVF